MRVFTALPPVKPHNVTPRQFPPSIAKPRFSPLRTSMVTKVTILRQFLDAPIQPQPPEFQSPNKKHLNARLALTFGILMLIVSAR